MRLGKHRLTRFHHYLLLVLTLGAVYVTQVAIPAPCNIAGTIIPLDDLEVSGTGRVTLPPGETGRIALKNYRSQCKQCSNIMWRIVRQGRNVMASIEEVGDDLIVTFMNTGQTGGLAGLGDTVYIEGTYDDPIGLNPLTGNPLFTVQRTVRANVLFRTR